MGRKYIPVACRDRLYKLFGADLRRVKCISKRTVPGVPRFDEGSNSEEERSLSVFKEIVEEESF
jgi:hypothetical protein